MFLLKNDINSPMLISIAVMCLLFGSFMLIFLLSQRKKTKYHKDMQALREAQHNQLIEAAVRSEEIERNRIAETLHDEVGAILSSSKLHIQGIKTDALDERDKQLHEKGKELLDEGIQKVRGISHNLHSNILRQFGLNEAVRHFVNNTVKGTLVQASVDLDDKYDTYNTKNPENDISIYRMIQELLNNIIKYANAKEININSSFANSSLQINIHHNGKGLTQEDFKQLRYNKEGLGLKNIQNRITLLKGNILFLKTQNNYEIKITIPVKELAP